MGHRIVTTLLLVVATTCAAFPAAAVAVSPERARTEGTNPTIAQRFLRYDRWVRTVQAPPDVLLLGSSRSVQLDPRQVRRLTGRTAFNAGVSDGAARELRAMADYADLRTPGDFPHLVIMLDLEAFDNRRPRVRILDYRRRIDAARRACDELAACRRAWMLAARRLSIDAAARQRGDDSWLATQRADGKQTDSVLAKLDRRGVDMAALTRQRIAVRVTTYRPPGFDRLYWGPKADFERILRLANQRGDRPFVAITGTHPDCIRICGRAGWADRRTEVRAYLDELAERHEFGLLDMSYPSTWRGTRADFFDEIHPRPTGAARIVRRLVAVGAFGRRAVG